MNPSQVRNISHHLIASAERLGKLADSRHGLANQFGEQAAELLAAHDAFLLHCLNAPPIPRVRILYASRSSANECEGKGMHACATLGDSDRVLAYFPTKASLERFEALMTAR